MSFRSNYCHLVSNCSSSANLPLNGRFSMVNGYFLSQLSARRSQEGTENRCCREGQHLFCGIVVFVPFSYSHKVLPQSFLVL